MNRGREWQVAGTGTPHAKLWARSSSDAVRLYLRTFRPGLGACVILRPVDAHELAELYDVTREGPRRLTAERAK